jgi:hypothetical protein
MDALHSLRHAVARWQVAIASNDPESGEILEQISKLRRAFDGDLPSEPGIGMLIAARRVIENTSASVHKSDPALPAVSSPHDHLTLSIPTHSQGAASAIFASNENRLVEQLLLQRMTSSHAQGHVQHDVGGQAERCIMHVVPISECRHLHAYAVKAACAGTADTNHSSRTNFRSSVLPANTEDADTSFSLLDNCVQSDGRYSHSVEQIVAPSNDSFNASDHCSFQRPESLDEHHAHTTQSCTPSSPSFLCTTRYGSPTPEHNAWSLVTGTTPPAAKHPLELIVSVPVTRIGAGCNSDRAVPCNSAHISSTELDCVKSQPFRRTVNDAATAMKPRQGAAFAQSVSASVDVAACRPPSRLRVPPPLDAAHQRLLKLKQLRVCVIICELLVAHDSQTLNCRPISRSQDESREHARRMRQAAELRVSVRAHSAAKSSCTKVSAMCSADEQETYLTEVRVCNKAEVLEADDVTALAAQVKVSQQPSNPARRRSRVSALAQQGQGGIARSDRQQCRARESTTRDPDLLDDKERVVRAELDRKRALERARLAKAALAQEAERELAEAAERQAQKWAARDRKVQRFLSRRQVADSLATATPSFATTAVTEPSDSFGSVAVIDSDDIAESADVEQELLQENTDKLSQSPRCTRETSGPPAETGSQDTVSQPMSSLLVEHVLRQLRGPCGSRSDGAGGLNTTVDPDSVLDRLLERQSSLGDVIADSRQLQQSFVRGRSAAVTGGRMATTLLMPQLHVTSRQKQHSSSIGDAPNCVASTQESSYAQLHSSDVVEEKCRPPVVPEAVTATLQTALSPSVSSLFRLGTPVANARRDLDAFPRPQFSSSPRALPCDSVLMPADLSTNGSPTSRNYFRFGCQEDGHSPGEAASSSVLLPWSSATSPLQVTHSIDQLQVERGSRASCKALSVFLASESLQSDRTSDLVSFPRPARHVQGPVLGSQLQVLPLDISLGMLLPEDAAK